jgi:hypothetical protein
MDMKQKKTRIVLSVAALAVVILAGIFILDDGRPDRKKSGAGLPFSVENMDRVYLYKDRFGATHISGQIPQGYDYQVVYVPKRTDGENLEQFKEDMGEKARMMMRGEHPSGGEGKELDSNPSPPLSKVSAGSVLSRSNAMRRQAEQREHREKR